MNRWFRFAVIHPDLDLFDLNRVETLRGPRGTLFGSGSVGERLAKHY
ncbi:MAG: Plug domain-containing protein [Sphingomonadales bacterium]|nr:Plug domain-containing protein [Sphingomonadales bacterium]